MVSDKLKSIIFKKLYSELSHLEIIRFKSEIWFIDREVRCWYFIYNDNGTMWWKNSFFRSFFEFFSITEIDEFGSILSSWVGEVLNCKVDRASFFQLALPLQVEEVLNCKVITTDPRKEFFLFAVEEVLKHKSERLGHPPVSENVVINNTEK
jgi:hypothetical protein